MADIDREIVSTDDIELANTRVGKNPRGSITIDGRSRALSTTERLRGYSDVDEEGIIDANEEGIIEGNRKKSTRARSMTFTPWVPDNAATIVTWENMIVSTKTNPKKVLLNNVTGQITGGFWAIMVLSLTLLT
jgi:hypothetical protein